jgi:hypothetical protein
MFPRGTVSLVAACTLLVLLAGPCAAQTQPPSQPQPAPDLSQVPLSLDRIREGVLREQKLNIPFLAPDTPVFRVHVEENGIKLSDYWKIGPDTAVGRNVRPPFASAWHNEFINMTTPKQQVAASAFGLFGNPGMPVGMPVLEISKAIQKAWRNYQLERIRKQIQDELAQIEENRRRQPEKPQPPPPQ